MSIKHSQFKDMYEEKYFNLVTFIFIVVQPTKHHGESTSNYNNKKNKVLLLVHILVSTTFYFLMPGVPEKSKFRNRMNLFL